MRFKDQFRFVRQNMKKNKMRIFMTILASAMGCAFLIVLASVGFGLHKSIIQDVTQDRLVTEINVHAKKDDTGNYNEINDEDIAYLESIKDVKAVTRRQRLEQVAHYKYKDKDIGTDTLVVHYPSEVKAKFELSEGRLPTKPSEVVIGYHFPNVLFMNQDPAEQQQPVKTENLIGKTIQMEVQQFVDGKEEKKTFDLVVVGITKKPTKDWFQDQSVYISQDILDQIEDFTGTKRGQVITPDIPLEMQREMTVQKERTYNEVYVYATNIEKVEDITTLLEKKHYATHSIVKEMKQINLIFLIIKIGLVFIGTIAIIIASIGIYNTMTMAVTERAPDIGIMKAIGANPSTIKRIFLIESSYIGILGALIGTVVAYGISFVVNFSLPLIIKQAFNEAPPENLMFSYIPFTLPIICIGLSFIITIISGMRPAKRATQIDVLKAMRREL